jgi:hypothetical protein
LKDKSGGVFMIADFKNYIEAEAKEILMAIDEEALRDPDCFRTQAIAWIEKNAEGFRRKWEQQAAC